MYPLIYSLKFLQMVLKKVLKGFTFALIKLAETLFCGSNTYLIAKDYAKKHLGIFVVLLSSVCLL